MINFCLKLFIEGHVSYRSCSKICSILSSFCKVPIPHYSTIRQWVHRLGFYALHKTKTKRNDWVYIVDYTIAASKNKCLAILGVPLSNLRKRSFILRMQDVVLLYLYVTPKANWEVTYNALVEVSEQTGVPKEIISDHGADVKKGIEEFCKDHQETHYVYDVSHLSACSLKSIISKDLKWNSFIKRMLCCKHQTKQSTLSFLSPPSQRAKARYLNTGQMISWAEKIIKFQEQSDYSLIAKSITEKKANRFLHNKKKPFDSVTLQESMELFEDKFGWLQDYINEITEYKQCLKVIEIIKGKIVSQGICKATIDEIKKELSIMKLEEKALKLEMIIMDGLLKNIPENAKYQETYLGISDIIESLFGKYKYHCAESSLMGITQSILILGTATVDIDISIVINAMQNYRYTTIQDWSKKIIGESDFSKRIRAFSVNNDLKVA